MPTTVKVAKIYVKRKQYQGNIIHKDTGIFLCSVFQYNPQHRKTELWVILATLED